MTAADIKADENSNPGTYMLKRWLEYSATGVLQRGEQTRREPDSDFEIFVAEQIRAMGCEAVPQVGVAGYFIDIGVKHPQWPHGFIMAVECDGATYHSSKSARDRDRLRQEVLEQLGWFFHRIWSVDWFNNPQREAEKLREGIENRLNNLKNASPDQNSAMFTAESEASRLVGDTPSEDFGQSDIDHGAMNSERPATSGATGVGIAANQQLSAEDPTLISVGDKVRIRYLSGTQTTIEITISDAINAPDRGYIYVQAPLGEALLGAEEGDEVDVLVGSYLRRAVIEKVTKRKAPSSEGVTRTNRANESNKVEPSQPYGSKNSGERQTKFGFSEVSPQRISRSSETTLSADRFYDPSYPEKLGLAFSILANASSADPAGSMASKIGFGRLRQTTRDELEELIRTAKLMDESL